MPELSSFIAPSMPEKFTTVKLHLSHYLSFPLPIIPTNYIVFDNIKIQASCRTGCHTLN